MHTLVNLGFVVLWSAVVGFALDVAGRRFVREPRSARALGAIGGGAFLIGALVSPFHHPAPLAGAVVPSRALATCAGRGGVRPAGGAVGNLDSIVDGDTKAALADGASVSRLHAIAVAGWAADRSGTVPAQTVCLAIDGAIADSATAAYGGRRPDVAAVKGVPALADTGFTIDVPPDSLPAGRHAIGVAVLNGDGSTALLASRRTLSLR